MESLSMESTLDGLIKNLTVFVIVTILLTMVLRRRAGLCSVTPEELGLREKCPRS